LGRYMRLLTWDNAQAREAVCKLPTAGLEVLCCGHGAPIVTGAGGQIERLVREGRC
jgi:hypothetical protein